MMSSKLLIPYQNKWVALTEDKTKVVDFDKNVKTLHQRLTKKKVTGVVLMYVMSFTKYSLAQWQSF